MKQMGNTEESYSFGLVSVENVKVQAYQEVAKYNAELNILLNMTCGY